MTGRKPNFPETETHHDSGHLAGLRAGPFIGSGVVPNSVGQGSGNGTTPAAFAAPDSFGTQQVNRLTVGPRTPCGPGVAQTVSGGDRWPFILCAD